MNYPQQPPYGQQGPYGQQPPYGQPYGQQPYGQQPYGYGPPPKKSRTGLIVGIVIGVVVLLGGGTVAAFLIFGGPDDPMPTAQAYADAVNKRDTNAMANVLCDPPLESEKKQWLSSLSDEGVHIDKVEMMDSRSSESVGVLLHVSQSGPGGLDNLRLSLKWKSGRWCHDSTLSATGLPS